VAVRRGTVGLGGGQARNDFGNPFRESFRRISCVDRGGGGPPSLLFFLIFNIFKRKEGKEGGDVKGSGMIVVKVVILNQHHAGV
jgi:hypothetical protein